MKSGIKAALAAVLLASCAVVLSTGAASAAGFKVVKLTSDQSGVAPFQDTNLINPWGLSQSPGGPVWVSDNGTGLSTVYSRTTGKPTSTIVTIPMGGPTGTVYTSSSLGFDISENGKSGAAIFLFDTTSGAIEGWADSVDPNNAVVAVNNSGSGASYTGLGVDTAAVLLFAANNAQNKVEIYNNKFALQGSFTDTSLPSGYAPYNVVDINGTVYVTFSKFGSASGYVDTFNTSGVLQKQLIAGSPLNEPWGLAIAPSSFGSFSNDLLVGNLGNGEINAFNPSTGALIGTLKNSKGKPIKISGLWALDSGPNSNQVNFSAGPGGYAHGLFGLVQAGK